VRNIFCVNLVISFCYHLFGFRYHLTSFILFFFRPVQRPFINDFSSYPNTVWNKYVQKHPEFMVGKVKQGHPAAQDYSFGSQWLSAVGNNLTYVVGPESPVHEVTQDEAQHLYAAGPPYWMTARDAYRIAYHWSDFLPRIFQLKPVFMAEVRLSLNYDTSAYRPTLMRFLCCFCFYVHRCMDIVWQRK
jgi:hypothetical protein